MPKQWRLPVPSGRLRSAGSRPAPEPQTAGVSPCKRPVPYSRTRRRFVPAWFCWTTELIWNVSPGSHTIDPVTVATVLLSVSVAFVSTPTNSTWAIAALLVRSSAPNTSDNAKSSDFDFEVIFGFPPLIFVLKQQERGCRRRRYPTPEPRIRRPRNAESGQSRPAFPCRRLSERRSHETFDCGGVPPPRPL